MERKRLGIDEPVEAVWAESGLGAIPAVIEYGADVRTRMMHLITLIRVEVERDSVKGIPRREGS